MGRKRNMQRRKADKKEGTEDNNRKCGQTAIERTTMFVQMELLQMELLRASARR